MHTFWKFPDFWSWCYCCYCFSMFFITLFSLLHTEETRMLRICKKKTVIKRSMPPKILSWASSHIATKLAIHVFKMIVLTDFSLNKDSIKHLLYSWSSHKIIRSSHLFLVTIIIVIYLSQALFGWKSCSRCHPKNTASAVDDTLLKQKERLINLS